MYMNSLPSIGSYGNYSSSNYGVNTQYVELGPVTLYYSYKTIVAFSYRGKQTVCENCWGNTTGKHLNWINRDHSIRLSRTEFIDELEKVLKEHNLILDSYL